MATGPLVIIPRPPIGFPVTRQQQQQFVNDYMMLSAPNATPVDQKVVRILALMYSLNTARGVDYRTNLPQLLNDAAAYTGGISIFNQDAALAAIEWSNAATGDATIPSSLQALRALHPGLWQRRDDTLDRIIAMLEIRIGQ